MNNDEEGQERKDILVMFCTGCGTLVILDKEANILFEQMFTTLSIVNDSDHQEIEDEKNQHVH